MREHEYKARDKTVNKMSRDGLVEENLQKKESVRVSQRELDDLTLPRQAADPVSFQKEKSYSDGRGQRDNISPNAENSTKKKQRQRQSVNKRRLYEAQKKDALPEPTGNPLLSEPPVQPTGHHTYSLQEPDSGGDMETEVPETGADRGLSEHSSRLESIRGHPSGRGNYAEALAETSHSRKKKLVQAHFKKENEKQADGGSRTGDYDQKNTRYRETSGDAEKTLDSAREGIRKKQKREQINKEQKKQSSRLSFGDDESGMGIGKKAASAASHSMSAYAHGRVHEAEQENSAAEGAHRAEIMAEHSLRYAGEVAIPADVIDEVLRNGSNKDGSQLRIIYNFMIDQEPGEYTEFVRREYGRGGIGLTIGGKEYSVWYDELGMQIAVGHTVTDRILDKAFLSWEDVSGRIQQLLKQGEYTISANTA